MPVGPRYPHPFCLRMNGRFAPIPVTHELIGVFVKSYQ
jgi:hypothetical protein